MRLCAYHVRLTRGLTISRLAEVLPVGYSHTAYLTHEHMAVQGDPTTLNRRTRIPTTAMNGLVQTATILAASRSDSDYPGHATIIILR